MGGMQKLIFPPIKITYVNESGHEI